MRRLVLLLFLWAAPALAEPKIALLIVIDQFPSTHMDRMPAEGAVRRLAATGAYYPGAVHDHVPTETAPGHATISTGRPPGVHGITGNTIYDRSTRTTEPAAVDPERGIGWFRLRSPTVGDALRSGSPASRVVAVAGKDRSAIFLGGRSATRVLWYDDRRGGFVTSAAYGAEPSWLSAANLDIARSKSIRSPFSARDPRSAPFLDRATVRVATQAIVAEGLGLDDAPDVLAVSLSATDHIGHRWGPDSPQMEANLAELDRRVRELVDAVIAVDPGALVALTSDHGILPLPGSAASREMNARRVGIQEFRLRLEAGLQKSRPSERAWIERLDIPDIYMSLDGVADRADWLRQAASIIAGDPDVAAVYIPGRRRFLDAHAAAYRRSHAPGLSGDLQIRMKPGILVTRWPSGTSHGSPYVYDSRVPLIFWGAGVKPGRHPAPVSIRSVAPTLAAALGAALEPDGVRVLSEAFVSLSRGAGR